METFLLRCRLRNFSHRTLERYADAFRLFERFHQEHNLSCTPLTCPPEHIQGFVWWRLRFAKAVTVNGYWRVLRTFFRWLVKEGLRSDCPTEKTPEPKADAPLPRTVTEDHFVKTLQALDLSRWANLRDAALFCLAFDSGARLSELTNLRLCDVDLQNQMARVKGKGGKERFIYFGRVTASLLQRYLVQRALKFGYPPSPEAFLFVTTEGTPLTRNRVRYRWYVAQKKAGLKPLPFHGLRHGFARMWLLRGGDAFSLQILLGHASAETTKRYVTLWASDLQRMHRERSPIDSLAPTLKILRKRIT